MNSVAMPKRSGSMLAVGALLVIIGLLAVIGRAADVDLGGLIGEQTWPLLVIVPGLVLLTLAIRPAPPEGLGFAIAGSIVTMVGAILLFMANTGSWASWAYAWLLIPGAAGLGILGYGAFTRHPELVTKGARLLVISAALFVVGWWWFEAIFATGEVPFDAGAWWPLALIVVGGVIGIAGLRRADGG